MQQKPEGPDWERIIKLLAMGWFGWKLLSEDDRRWLTEILRQMGTSSPQPPPRFLPPRQSPSPSQPQSAPAPPISDPPVDEAQVSGEGAEFTVAGPPAPAEPFRRIPERIEGGDAGKCR